LKERKNKRDSGEVERDNTFVGVVRNYITGFEGSQAVPARPSIEVSNTYKYYLI
jgi:hypothetical protein